MVKTSDILKIIQEYCKQYHISISKYAKLAGVSKAWLSRLLHNPNKKLSLQVADKLLSVAGYRLKIIQGSVSGIQPRRLVRC